MTLFRDLEGRAAEVFAEVGVSSADDTKQMAPVLFDIEEFDDLLGNRPAIATGPVGGGDENEWLIHSQRRLFGQRRQPHCRVMQLRNEAVRVLGVGREVDQQHCRQATTDADCSPVRVAILSGRKPDQ